MQVGAVSALSCLINQGDFSMGDKRESDGALGLLSDGNRRVVLEYLRDRPDHGASFEELVTHLSRRAAMVEERDQRSARFEIALHHRHLPKLDDHGLLDYDGRSGAVRYHPNERVERLLDEYAGVEAGSH